jgi:hypothetical protein
MVELQDLQLQTLVQAALGVFLLDTSVDRVDLGT